MFTIFNDSININHAFVVFFFLLRHIFLLICRQCDCGWRNAIKEKWSIRSSTSVTIELFISVVIALFLLLLLFLCFFLCIEFNAVFLQTFDVAHLFHSFPLNSLLPTFFQC